MSETVNQEATTATGAPAPAAEPPAQRTFTQSEVDAIVRERLTRERSKYADYDELKAKAAQRDEAEQADKTDLQKATERADKLQRQLDALSRESALREMRAKVAADTNLPAALVNMLNADTEEACMAQAKAILEFARPGSYPAVKDGGEPSGRPAGSAREQFAAWFEQATNR